MNTGGMSALSDLLQEMAQDLSVTGRYCERLCNVIVLLQKDATEREQYWLDLIKRIFRELEGKGVVINPDVKKRIAAAQGRLDQLHAIVAAGEEST